MTLSGTLTEKNLMTAFAGAVRHGTPGPKVGLL